MGAAWTFLGLAALGEAIIGHVRLERGLRRASPLGSKRPSAYPSITVLRPVRGRDRDARENFAAALEMDYPGEVETIFLFDEETDPGLPLAREVVSAHARSGKPGHAEVRVVGQPPTGWTGKLHAMRVGARMARGELIAFGDSDTRPDRTVLRATVEALLADGGAGAAFAPIIARGAEHTAGDAGYALLLNAWYHPLVAGAAARGRGRMPFLMGQLMVFTRAGLAAIGGIDCARGSLVDDMLLGQRLLEAGKSLVLAPHALPVVIGGMSFPEFTQAFRRWLIFSRAGLPLRFTSPMWLRGAGIFLSLGAAAAALATGAWSGLATSAAALGAYTASVWRLQSRSSGAPLPRRHLWLSLSIPFLGAWAFASGLLKRRVSWRGRSYALSPGAQLASR